MKETLYERTLRELPEKLTEKELNEGKKLLGEFLYENPSEYFMLMTPYADVTSSHYYTVFKVEDDALEGIFNFIVENVGSIQKVEQSGNRFDVYINKQLYSLFGYDSGIVVV